MDLADHAGHPRHDVGHAIGVERDLGRQLQGLLQLAPGGLEDLDVKLPDRLLGELQPAFNVLLVTFLTGMLGLAALVPAFVHFAGVGIRRPFRVAPGLPGVHRPGSAKHAQRQGHEHTR